MAFIEIPASVTNLKSLYIYYIYTTRKFIALIFKYVGKIERLAVRLAGSLVAAVHKAVKGRSLRHYVRLKLHKAV